MISILSNDLHSIKFLEKFSNSNLGLRMHVRYEGKNLNIPRARLYSLPINPSGVASNPLPDNKILDWSKLKQSAEENFEFDVDSRKFSKLVENTVGKGEIARYEQFLLFPQCFQKDYFLGASRVLLCGNGLSKNDHQFLLGQHLS